MTTIVMDTEENYLGRGQLTMTVLRFNDECIGHGQLTTIVVLTNKLSINEKENTQQSVIKWISIMGCLLKNACLTPRAWRVMMSWKSTTLEQCDFPFLCRSFNIIIHSITKSLNGDVISPLSNLTDPLWLSVSNLFSLPTLQCNSP